MSVSASLQERMEAVDILHVFMCTCMLCGCPGLHDFVKTNQLLFWFFFVFQSVAQEAPSICNNGQERQVWRRDGFKGDTGSWKRVRCRVGS